jgi:DNA mismatch endonuclease (patch repair protein)
MTDIVDSETRSRMMAGIKGGNTRPELLVRKFLHSKGFRYRLHDVALPGRPDITLPRYHTVVLVHGCFWHRHTGCPLAYSPRSNEESWRAKFERNVERDKENVRDLVSLGWQVIIIWECGLRHKKQCKLEWLPQQIKSGKSGWVYHWP